MIRFNDLTAERLSTIIWLASVTCLFSDEISMLILCPPVILYYDYFLLFKEEIEFFWGSKLSWTAGLFLSTRYLALFGHLPVIFQALHPSSFNPKVCQPFKNYIVISNRIVAFIDVQSYTWFLLPATLNCRVAATT